MVSWGLEKSKFTLKHKTLQNGVPLPQPLVGKIKIKFYGNYKGNPSPLDIGRAFRDLKQKSSPLSLEASTPTNLVLQDLQVGLFLSKKHNWSNLLIKGDSLVVIEYMSKLLIGVNLEDVSMH